MNSIPRQHKETFHQVLHNIDNQVIVRELVETYMSDEEKAEVLRLYNEDVDRYNAVVDRQQKELALEAARRLTQTRAFLEREGIY